MKKELFRKKYITYIIILKVLIFWPLFILAKPITTQDIATKVTETEFQRLVTSKEFKGIMPDFSGVSSLYVNQKEMFSIVSGFADIRHSLLNTKLTRFPICSLSKQFVAAAIFKLVEQGKIDLDDSLAQHINGLNSLELNGAVCTIRHAMNHRCGLPRRASSDTTGHLTNQSTRSSYLASIQADGLIHPPGSKMLYSNTGYNLLGLVVQDVTAKKYEQFLQEVFFKPLQMLNTGITPHGKKEQYARGLLWMKWFNLDAPSFLQHDPHFASTVGSAGNIYSTVDDLHKWNIGLHTGQILSKISYDHFLMIPEGNKSEKVDKNNLKTGGYASGVIVETHNELKMIWHNGALMPYGFSTFMGYVPNSKTSLVVLTNHNTTISNETRASKQLLRWIHHSKDQLDPIDLHWSAYLLPMVISLIFLLIPFYSYQLIRLFQKGHAKGNGKALLQVISQVIYMPMLLSLLWGGPFRAALLYGSFSILVSLGVWFRFHFFAMGYHEISRLKLIAHGLVMIILMYIDFLLALYMMISVFILALTYYQKSKFVD